jgi:DNA repair protein RecO (recombination protein O)
MFESYGYILRNRPFRESSRLLDVFTQDHGRIPCIARPAKKRGKIIAGTLEPFRYLELHWIGRKEVMTLTLADEQGRHNIATEALLNGIYLNELVLRLTQQYCPLPELFRAYKQTLHRLTDVDKNPYALMRFELFLLHVLGYDINLECDDANGEALSHHITYCYIPQQGIIKNHPNRHQNDGVVISGELLIALRDLETMAAENWQELRYFLDKMICYCVGKPLNSRKLLTFL